MPAQASPATTRTNALTIGAAPRKRATKSRTDSERDVEVARLLGWTDIHQTGHTWHGIPPDEEEWLEAGETKDAIPIPQFSHPEKLRIILIIHTHGHLRGQVSMRFTDKIVRPYHHTDEGDVLVFRLVDFDCGEPITESLHNGSLLALLKKSFSPLA